MENEIENLAELEEQLYAQVYHDSNLEVINEDQPTTSSAKPNQSAKMRYWQNQKPSNTNAKFNNNFNKNKYNKNKKPVDSENSSQQQQNEVIAEKLPIQKPCFVPYSSVLSFMNNPQPILEDDPIKNKIIESDEQSQALPKSYEKKKTKLTKFPKEKGKFLKPAKKLMKVKYEEKKAKAQEVRKKLNNNKIETIDLAATSSDDDSVIHIESAPPPLISVDSSDDETRKSKKRAASPSTSSMVSDDFIVACDKRRLINPFANSAEQVATAVIDNKIARKMKATKVSSSSSNSNSARSSCERNICEDSSTKKNKRKKVCNSNDAGDSIYSKAMTSKKQSKSVSSTSSSDEDQDNSICATATRRKSTGSRSEDQQQKSCPTASSTPLAPKKKRSRFITPNYNEDEFASLISTAIEPDVDVELSETINSAKALIETIEKEVHEKPIEKVIVENQNDVEIIEQPVQVYDVSDEDALMDSDSEDSIKNVSTNLEYDLTLNIKQNEYTPHEFVPIENTVTHAGHDANKLDCEVGWNDEMRFFHNESTSGRDFCILAIRNSMPQNPSLWKINYADRTRTFNDNDRRIKCRNCNEWGHKERFCTRPRKKVICIMCGGIGHRETRCPNSICLRCGKPNVVYATMCGNCSKFSKKVCPLCNNKGHDIDVCPDKWRRYHSTTSMPDNQSTLDISYELNPKVYCSLCARSGHFAENCSYMNKMFHGLIKSSWFVISAKPSYPTNYSFNGSRENEQVLQLMTYLENYSFNIKIPSNCQFYPKFKEEFLRHKELLGRAATGQNKQKKKRKKDRRNKGTQSTKVAESGLENARSKVDDDSNSNYSFSEFYKSNTEAPSTAEENQIVSVQNDPQMLGDYVPLVSVNTENSQLFNNQQNQVCDSKVMLTKEHTTILMSRKGQNLLFDLGERFNIVAQFRFDLMGNSICLTGLPLNQQLFHDELKGFLYKCGLDEYERLIERTTQIPKIICRIVTYLRSNFQSIKNGSGIRETKQLLDKLTAAEKSLDHKRAIKLRKALNVIFIGHAELGDGARHVSELRKILGELEKEVLSGNGDAQVDPKLRNEISIHIKYVFSAVDHSSLYGDYWRMFDEYKKVIMRRYNNSRNNNALSSNR